MIGIADTSTPVVILKAVAYGPLGIVRSLGRLGISVYVAGPDRRAAASASRYCRGKFLCHPSLAAAEASITRLLDIGRTIGRPALLIPTTDELAILVDEHAPALRECFIFPQQPAGLPRALANKQEMHYLAEKSGLATARTRFPTSRHDVLEFAQTATFPLMLKGIDTKKLSARAGRWGQGMFLVQNASELVAKYDRYEDPQAPNLMLQEYIPGGDDSVWMFNGYFAEDSSCVLGFTGQKLRQCPPGRGVTSLGVCRANETVAQTTCRFMKQIGYRGILDIGYRYDARDGRYKVLDVNPRVGATFRLFVAVNGLDVVRALYLGMTGQPIEPAVQREGRRWVVEDLDVYSSWCYWRRGEWRLRDWVASFRGVEESAYRAWDDPVPVWAMLVNGTRKAWRLVSGSKENGTG